MDVRHLAVSDVVFRKDLYPRIDTSPSTVQQYAEDLSVLPPIEVNQHNILIDGWHRLTAYRTMDVDTIPCIVTETESEAQLFEFSIIRNASHGLQLASEDKMKYARQQMYGLSGKASTERQKEVAKVLSVSLRAVNLWTEKQRKDSAAENKEKAAQMWLACYTQEDRSQRHALHLDGQCQVGQKNLAIWENFPKSPNCLNLTPAIRTLILRCITFGKNRR